MIRLKDNYCIDVEEKCYTVKINLHKTDKKGNTLYTTIGYYKDLEGAIKGVISHMNKQELQKDCTLEEALKILQNNNRQFEDLLRKAM
jgi:uncharacterized protein (DUF488 family)